MKIVVIGGTGLIGSRLVTKLGDHGHEAESDAQQATGLPVSEWLFDPADIQREEVELRALLGAIEELEGDPRPRRRGPGGGA
ncbi:hypothetical protein NE236_04250 [Actinoallomurus purpureus]|uniref:hypothetical protein n=1 Tax=Actinoallomurus purpureus TaxID=478114 RepID=UPI002092F5AA|nr:hypothetical protein [Actinoallomurus purpureus]MCO6004182.1 hypothetical protein [Actinoallomurus purpureus]